MTGPTLARLVPSLLAAVLLACCSSGGGTSSPTGSDGGGGGGGGGNGQGCGLWTPGKSACTDCTISLCCAESTACAGNTDCVECVQLTIDGKILESQQKGCLTFDLFTTLTDCVNDGQRCGPICDPKLGCASVGCASDGDCTRLGCTACGGGHCVR